MTKKEMTVKCRMSPYLASEKDAHRFLRKTQPDDGYGSKWGAGFPAIFCSSLPVLRFSETHDYGRTSFPYFTMRALDLTNSPAIPSERLSCYRVFSISSPPGNRPVKTIYGPQDWGNAQWCKRWNQPYSNGFTEGDNNLIETVKNRRRNTWFREIEEQVFSQLDKTKNQQMYCQHPNGN